MARVDTGCTVTVFVAKKGNWPYAAQAAVRFLSMCGDRVALQGDAEESLQRLFEAMAKARPEGTTTARSSPPYSHESNGVAARMHSTIGGQLRALLTHVKRMANKTVVPEDRLSLVRRNGTAPYMALTGTPERAKLCIFGET
eukprot:3635706-Alexandrium_andersonii.AAC.1